MTDKTDYRARNRGPLWCFLVVTDRFTQAWFNAMGMMYLIGVPLSLSGIGLAGLWGLIWAALGLFWGDARWGWPGLLTKETTTA